MPLNAEDDLALKRELESSFLRTLRGFAFQLALDLRTQLAGGPSPNLVGMGKPMLRAILRKHYTDVGIAFSHDLTDAMPSDVPVMANERVEIEIELNRIYDIAAEQQSEIMMASAQKIAIESIAKAEALILADEKLTLRDRPQLAATIFQVRRLGNAGAAACTETEFAAERAKAVEAEVLAGESGVNTPKFRGSKIKVWRTQGDSKVRGFKPGFNRFNHFLADGLEAEGDGFFTVSGEKLRWPGDTSFGASLGNVINCRCSAIYDVNTVAELRRILIVPEVVDLFPSVILPAIGEPIGLELLGVPVAIELLENLE